MTFSAAAIYVQFLLLQKDVQGSYGTWANAQIEGSGIVLFFSSWHVSQLSHTDNIYYRFTKCFTHSQVWLSGWTLMFVGQGQILSLSWSFTLFAAWYLCSCFVELANWKDKVSNNKYGKWWK